MIFALLLLVGGVAFGLGLDRFADWYWSRQLERSRKRRVSEGAAIDGQRVEQAFRKLEDAVKQEQFRQRHEAAAAKQRNNELLSEVEEIAGDVGLWE